MTSWPRPSAEQMAEAAASLRCVWDGSRVALGLFGLTARCEHGHEQPFGYPMNGG